MPNSNGNGIFSLDPDDLVFPNMTTSTPVKQEDPEDYVLPLNVNNGANGSGAANGGGMLRQLMDVDNPVESLELNETSLVEGKKMQLNTWHQFLRFEFQN